MVKINTYEAQTRPETVKIGFLLLNGFSMISFANAIEVLRMGNYLSQQALYRWHVAHVDGDEAVLASNGLAVDQMDEDGLFECDIVFVCGGVNINAATTLSVKVLLRVLAGKGIPLGGMCTGSVALALAGLMDGYRCAAHWESLSAAIEAFPRVVFTDSIYVIDRDRYTASGGTASLDMMLHLVKRKWGRLLAIAISEQFVMERIRTSEAVQSVPRPDHAGPGYEHVINAIELMQANLDEVLTLSEIASLVSISLRQMERLFNRYCEVSPAQYYLRLRLRRAKELLSQTSLSIMQVTVACGFSTSSHFSKAYRHYYGHSPRDQRKPPNPEHRHTITGSAGLIPS